MTKKSKGLLQVLKLKESKAKSKSKSKSKKPKTTVLPPRIDLEDEDLIAKQLNETIDSIDTFNNSTSFDEESPIPKGTEDLCVRIHNNTAFEGVEPYDIQLTKNAYECQKVCVAVFPKCVGLVFYYIHGQEDDHICYLFDRNSVDPDIQLIQEKPKNEKDIIRALEIVIDCHQFDPFPPLGEDGVVTSTDKVPRSKRGLFSY